MSLIITGPDGKPRCEWCAATEQYMDYHDQEWGFPVSDDRRLFEKICLEGFQSGLSWLTILRKRDNFRNAFADFDYHRVARFNSRSVDRLLKDAGIVRHRGKMESTINNAKRAIELEDEFGSLSGYFWKHVPPKSDRPKADRDGGNRRSGGGGRRGRAGGSRRGRYARRYRSGDHRPTRRDPFRRRRGRGR